MGLIFVPQITDGTTHTAADHNNQANTIANEFNGNIDNNNIKSAAAIDPGKLAGGLTGMLGVWQTYTPSWTGSSSNPAIGNGTLSASYVQIGKLVVTRIGILMGSTTTLGTGTWSFSLPVNANSAQVGAAYANLLPLGPVIFKDSGKTNPGHVLLATASTIQLGGALTQSGANPVFINDGLAGGSGPLSATAGNVVVMSFSFEAA